MSFEPAAESVPALLRWRTEQDRAAPACASRTGEGDWRTVTWHELCSQVAVTSAALGRLGLRRGDRLAVLARTRREWQVAEMAALEAGAVVVGIEPHAAPEQIQYVLRHSRASFLVADNAQMVSAIPQDGLAGISRVIVFDGPTPSIGPSDSIGWQALQEPAVGAATTQSAPLKQDDPATIIYTSGTTGQPKAILYTHRQLLLACRSIVEAFPEICPGDAFLCWLPMAHLFQRMMNLAAIAKGAQTYFVEDPRDVMTAVRQVEPAVFVGVPRFYERLHEGIQQRLARLPRWLAPLVGAALAAGRQSAACRRERRRVPVNLQIRHAVLDRLILKPVRRVMGRNIKFMVTGSAPTPVWLLEFFHSIGLLLLEAYGVSENAVPMAANRVREYRFGSVGKPFAANQLRLADDGEIFVRGEGVFSGYEGEQDAAAAARFTDDGFYQTGDVGRLDEEGFLYLTGRKAEIIKTSTGRRVSPVSVESVYGRSPLIDQVVAVGNGRKYLVGLVAVCRAAVARRLAESGLPLPESGEQLAGMPEVVELVRRELERLGPELAPHERFADFAVLPEPLSIARGELTPTLKVRRERVAARYAEMIESLYVRAEARPEARTEAGPNALAGGGVA